MKSRQRVQFSFAVVATALSSSNARTDARRIVVDMDEDCFKPIVDFAGADEQMIKPEFLAYGRYIEDRHTSLSGAVPDHVFYDVFDELENSVCPIIFHDIDMNICRDDSLLMEPFIDGKLPEIEVKERIFAYLVCEQTLASILTPQTAFPSFPPTKIIPTQSPSTNPLRKPSTIPSIIPTGFSSFPTSVPSNMPSAYPSPTQEFPSSLPTSSPTNNPSYTPTISPSFIPSTSPSASCVPKLQSLEIQGFSLDSYMKYVNETVYELAPNLWPRVEFGSEDTTQLLEESFQKLLDICNNCPDGVIVIEYGDTAYLEEICISAEVFIPQTSYPSLSPSESPSSPPAPIILPTILGVAGSLLIIGVIIAGQRKRPPPPPVEVEFPIPPMPRETEDIQIEQEIPLASNAA